MCHIINHLPKVEKLNLFIFHEILENLKVPGHINLYRNVFSQTCIQVHSCMMCQFMSRLKFMGEMYLQNP